MADKVVDSVAQAILQNVEEAKAARLTRMEKNALNYNAYNLNQDFRHKKEGQSREVLAKQQQAVDQITSFLVQGVVDIEKWNEVKRVSKQPETQIKTSDVDSITNWQMKLNEPETLLSDAIKLGLLGSLCISKNHGRFVRKSHFEVEKLQSDAGGRKVSLQRKDTLKWQAIIEMIRQEDYYPDPTGRGLYEVQGIDIDHHELVEIAENNPDVYDVAAVRALNSTEDMEQRGKKLRETNQNDSMGSFRHNCRLYEFWGTLLKPDGSVLMRNCTSTIDYSGNVIVKPRENPNWHGKSPYVVAPMVRIPHSVWHRAIMDAATMMNMAETELFNLILDGGMMDVHGIKQIREDWLEDPNQITDGIPPGTTLSVTSSCPPGQKVLERVDTSSVPQEAIAVLNLVDREFQQSSLTNDVRMGTLPQRAVKATEIVASNQTLTGLMNGMVKMLEAKFITPNLDMMACNTAQNIKDVDPEGLADAIGRDRAVLIQAMEPEEVFAEVANGYKFRSIGLSTVLNKINDFRKITSLLQVIGGAPALASAFQNKYSFTKLLGKIMDSLDIETKDIEQDAQEAAQIAQQRQQEQQIAMMQATKGQSVQGGGGNQMSQVPNAGSEGPGGPGSQVQTGLSTGEAMG